MEHEFFMKMALDLAKQAQREGEVPVGAVVVHQNQVIGQGYNLREKLKSPTAHAEMLAITQASRHLNTRRLEGCSLYVTLEPCPMCAGAMIMAQINRCYFAAYDQRQGCGGSIYNLLEDPAFYHQCKVIGGIMEEEAQKLLQEFFGKKR